ncbi:stage VI sporulation protein D [Marininema mesophilum]|uniref:Stage VI sporulation protein D n=1 Tax=Marininema mesophilum TaxID=1048340 RepID=A0A1H2S1K3_9BACL|nr:LysM peptidoglycan-binding domain-containing protein [Marininema mesophilum]SDW25473.1 stage VI sporulation protein D [Marininema mesophilum]
MTANFNQLRFDILEKVRLHPQKPGIGTLLELDLYPDVEIEDQGSHLKIEGYLRLNGTYVPGQGYLLPEEGEESASQGEEFVSAPPPREEEIAYVIPVEITLPAERVDIDHIASEIESFDYKVLSPFELHIEAILSIDGLLNEEKAEENSEYELVDPNSEEEPLLPAEHGSEESSEPIFLREEEAHEEQSIMADEGHRAIEEQEQDMVARSHEPETENYDFVHVARYDGIHGVLSRDPSDTDGNEDPAESKFQTNEIKSSESPQFSTEESETEAFSENQEEKPQLFTRDREGWNESNSYLRQPHIGEFDFQELGEDERRKLGIEHLSDLAHEEEPIAARGGEENQLSEESEPVAEAIQKSEESSSGLDWARWILQEEKEEFVKVRMVIVQKEDSLDTLAERYEVPVNKILHLNHLESNVLEQGQVVYIPRD